MCQIRYLMDPSQDHDGAPAPRPRPSVCHFQAILNPNPYTLNPQLLTPIPQPLTLKRKTLTKFSLSAQGTRVHTPRAHGLWKRVSLPQSSEACFAETRTRGSVFCNVRARRSLSAPACCSASTHQPSRQDQIDGFQTLTDPPNTSGCQGKSEV